MSNCNFSNNNEYPSDCEVTEGLRKIARSKASIQERSNAWKKSFSKAKNIKLLLLDVDGVLTDGNLIYHSDGQESKSFNTQDGFGLRLLQESNIDVGLITARKSQAVAERSRNLKIKYVYQGVPQKLSAYKEILNKSGYKPFEVAYMGDDWLDMVLLKRVGFAIAPANATGEILGMVDYTTKRSGGYGAVREVCDLILESQGLLPNLVQKYMNR